MLLCRSPDNRYKAALNDRWDIFPDEHLQIGFCFDPSYPLMNPSVSKEDRFHIHRSFRLFVSHLFRISFVYLMIFGVESGKSPSRRGNYCWECFPSWHSNPGITCGMLSGAPHRAHCMSTGGSLVFSIPLLASAGDNSRENYRIVPS